jgi:hypothetical protein
VTDASETDTTTLDSGPSPHTPAHRVLTLPSSVIRAFTHRFSTVFVETHRVPHCVLATTASSRFDVMSATAKKKKQKSNVKKKNQDRQYRGTGDGRVGAIVCADRVDIDARALLP